MADLRTYERSSESQQMPMADVMSPAEKLIGTLRQFSDNRMKQAQGAADYGAAKAGEKAGNQLGYQERAPITEADKAFNQAAKQAHQALIHTEIQTNIMKARADAIDNLSPNSLTEFNANVEGFSKGLLSSVGEGNQDYAKNLLNYYSTTNQMQVSSAVRGLNKQIQLANTLDFVNKISSQANDAAFAGDTISSAALFHDMQRKLDAGLYAGIVSPAQHENQIKATRSDINISHYMGQFQRQLQDGKGKEAYQHFMDKVHPDTTGHTNNLSYTEADSIRSKMHTMLQVHQQEQALKFGSLSKEVGDFVAANTNNVGLDQVTVKEKAANLISQIVEAHPEDSYDRQQQLRQVQFGLLAQNVLSEAQWSSPAERADMVNKIAATEQKRGVELTKDEVQNYSALINSVKAMDKQLKDDPAAYAFQHPAVKQALENRQQQLRGQVSLTGDTLQTAGLPQQQLGKGAPLNTDPYYSAIQIQKKMGIPDKDISLIPKTELADFASSISNLGAEDALKAVQQKIGQYPGYENIAAKNLSKVVKFPVMALLNAYDNPTSRARMSLLYQAANNSEEELKKRITKDQSKNLVDNVKNAIQSNYGEAVLNMPGDPTSAINAYTEISTKAAMVYSLNGVANPAQQAVNDLVNGHINTFRVNGHRVMIPGNIDASSTQRGAMSLMQSLRPESLDVPGYFYPGLPLERRQELYANNIALQGMASMNDNQDGMYIMDANRVPVKNSKGDYIGFSFKDLTDPSKAELHQYISAVDTAIMDYGKKPSKAANYILAR